MSDALSERGAQVGEKLDDMRDSARTMIAAGKKRVARIGEGVETYVQEQPMKSVLIAAGVGVVLGVLLARRR